MTEEIKKEFAHKYVRFAGFVDSGRLWDHCEATLDDKELMEHIQFCNDVMKIPPIKVFLLARNLAQDKEFADSPDKRQAVGAFFAFIFKELWGYKRTVRVSCSINGIKASTIYMKE